jgi:hypothetical protein
MLTFFSVPFMLTKVVALVLASIEVLSINENYKVVKGIDLWQSMKLLFSRAKEIKEDLNKIKEMTYTREQIAAAVKAKGYAWFDNGDLNLNIVGVRNICYRYKGY